MTEEKKFEDFLPNKNGSYFKEFEFQNEISLIKNEQIIECIKTVMDPEIPVNLYDLGLIYSIKNSNNNLVIEMTLTNPNCPVAGQMPENVAKSIEQIYGLRSIEVKLVWKPAWSKDLMSEDAKLALDIF
ncbi:metal-sulfur cluster assembly factor [bacterium]|nr:metal-sulfur cluster assembly factor [bacterium]